MSRFGLPYRAPCGGWPTGSRPGGGCYQHTRASEQAVQKLDNATLVDSYNGGAPIPPYTRVKYITPGEAGCKVACVPGDGEVPCAPWRGNDGHATTPPNLQGCVDAQVDFNCYHTTEGAFEDLSRCRKLGFKAAQARVVWHGRFGFNSSDPGNFAWQMPIHWDSGSSSAVGGGCFYELSAPTADQTKYLQSTVSNTVEFVTYDGGDSPAATFTSSAGATTLVDRYTGVITLTACHRDTTCDRIQDAWEDMISDFSPAYVLDLLTTTVSSYFEWVHDLGWTVVSNSFTPTSYQLSVQDPTGSYNSSVSFDGVAGSYSQSDDIGGTGGFPPRTRDISWDATSFTDRSYTKSSDRVVDSTCSDVVRVSIFEQTETRTGTLSVPYTATEAYETMVALLDEWDMTDDKVYPWRTDPFYGFAPLVSYDGKSGPVSPCVAVTCTVDDFMSPIGSAPYSAWNQRTWFDPGAYEWVFPAGGDPSTTAATALNPIYLAATVIGKPNPAGSQGFFDWNHITRRCCTGDSGDIYYEWGLGAWCGQSGAVDPTDAAMPATATQWTENGSDQNALPYGASNPWGAWIHHAGGICTAQKWAEIKIHRPGINFFGPCGPDRFTPDNSTVRCVTAVSGTTLTTESTLGALSAAECLVNDGTHSGVYQVSGSGTTYTLGTKLCDIPAGIVLSGYSIAQVRWPAAWSICGDVGVASVVVVSGSAHVTLRGAAPYLRTGDAVDFTDGDGGVTEANQTVTATDDTFADGTTPDGLHFKYAGSAPTGTRMKSHGAPGFWWYDRDSKGDFLYYTWEHDFRDIGEGDRMVTQNTDMALLSCATLSLPSGVVDDGSGTACTLRQLQASRGMPRSVKTFTATEDCLGFTPCWPQVVCFSPNGEDFENGKTYDFPGSPTLDDRYGYMWQGAVEFVIPDPFWQAPANPTLCVSCDAAIQRSLCSWAEDDGSCQENACLSDCPSEDLLQGGTRYYAHRPYVEARMSVPAAWKDGDTAPTLPEDVVIHVLTLDALNADTEPSGIVAAPPAGQAYVCGDISLPGLTVMPWTLWLAEIGCVCAGGALAPDYEANDVTAKCP